MLSLFLVALIALGGSTATASTTSAGSAPTATAGKPEARAAGDIGAQACTDATSSGGAKVRFCWTYGEGRDFYGNRLPMWRVDGEVYGASFGQILWVTTDGQAVWQSTARPYFVEYFTWASERPKFRACNSNGCGGWISA
ncbi:hypothetical protein [Actinophytocola sp.]|uniref:hypothetical protein n=1 Tax=Actinophytocola sp. TaxID=1872138 RepID=UPI0025BD67D4|nr:hypothetical protein [Actinophytocola sp.]